MALLAFLAWAAHPRFWRRSSGGHRVPDTTGHVHRVSQWTRDAVGEPCNHPPRLDWRGRHRRHHRCNPVMARGDRSPLSRGCFWGGVTGAGGATGLNDAAILGSRGAGNRTGTAGSGGRAARHHPGRRRRRHHRRDLGLRARGCHRYCASETTPASTRTPSRSRSCSCSDSWSSALARELMRPAAFTTRNQGRSRLAGRVRSAYPTCRAFRGIPASAATCP